jgi:hypothetical protein
MFHAVRNTFLAAAAVLTLGIFGGAAQAATVVLTNGATINPINVADVYTFDQILPAATSGGAGSVSFNFTANASQLPLSLFSATANLTFNNAVITGLYLSIFDGVNTVYQALSVTDLGNGSTLVGGSIANAFSSPNGLTQTLTLGWSGYSTGPKGTINLSLSVAAVPLPAGGLLLIGAIGGLAALRRRKALAA